MAGSNGHQRGGMLDVQEVYWKYSSLQHPHKKKKDDLFLFFETRYPIHAIMKLRQGREGGLVVDVDGGGVAAVLTTTSGSAAATATTPLTTVPTTVTTVTTASSTTTAVGALEASVDFEVNLFLLLGAGLGSVLGLKISKN